MSGAGKEKKKKELAGEVKPFPMGIGGAVQAVTDMHANRKIEGADASAQLRYACQILGAWAQVTAVTYRAFSAERDKAGDVEGFKWANGAMSAHRDWERVLKGIEDGLLAAEAKEAKRP